MSNKLKNWSTHCPKNIQDHWRLQLLYIVQGRTGYSMRFLLILKSLKTSWQRYWLQIIKFQNLTWLCCKKHREPVFLNKIWQWVHIGLMYRCRFQQKTGKNPQNEWKAKCWDETQLRSSDNPIPDLWDESQLRESDKPISDLWEVWKLDCLRMTSCRYFPLLNVSTELHRISLSQWKAQTCTRNFSTTMHTMGKKMSASMGKSFWHAVRLKSTWWKKSLQKRLAIRTRRMNSFITIE